MSNYLERYNNGEHKAVWDELIALGKNISDKDYAEATEVARVMMKRVRHNVELLYERLLKIGYKFASLKHAFVQAVPQERQKLIPDIENIFGKLPLSLRIWYEEVGDIAFIGAHPLLANLLTRPDEKQYVQPECCIYSDPLFCSVWEFMPEYLYTFTKVDATGYIDFSPDFYHKANVSGGGAIAIKLSDNPIDSIVHNFTREVYFIDYMRWSLHWGGFPGFEHHLLSNSKFGGWWNPKWKFPLIELSYLTEVLLEF